MASKAAVHEEAIRSGHRAELANDKGDLTGCLRTRFHKDAITSRPIDPYAQENYDRFSIVDIDAIVTEVKTLELHTDDIITIDQLNNVIREG